MTSTTSSLSTIALPDADVALTAVTFPGLVIRAYCERLAACCTGDAHPGFDVVRCIDSLGETETVPFTSLGLAYPGLASPYATLDATNAQNCIAMMSSLACGTNSAAALATLEGTCIGAYVPQLDAGAAGCQTSFDCAPGTYCGPIAEANEVGVPLVAAGGGTCLPLHTVGSACSDPLYSSDCTFQGGLANQAYCNGMNDTCEAAVAVGQPCTADEGCVSGQCQPVVDGGDSTCASTANFDIPFGLNYCARFVD
jgi:hypothetical protein